MLGNPNVSKSLVEAVQDDRVQHSVAQSKCTFFTIPGIASRETPAWSSDNARHQQVQKAKTPRATTNVHPHSISIDELDWFGVCVSL